MSVFTPNDKPGVQIVSLLWMLASLGPPLLLMAYGVFKARETWASRCLWVGVLAGACSAVLVAPLEVSLVRMLHLPASVIASPNPMHAIKTGFLVAALPEELAKFIALLLAMLMIDERRLRSLLMVSIAVAMGFAGLENILYLMHAGADWQTVALLRGGSAVPIHGVCGLMMGALVLGTIANDVDRLFGLAMALLVPIALHGTYDALMMLGDPAAQDWKTPVVVMAMLGGGLLAVGLGNTALHAAGRAGDAADSSARLGGMLRWVVKRAARAYLGLLLVPVVAGHFNTTTLWEAAFLAVLPAVLTLDVLFGEGRATPAPQLRPRMG